MSEETWFGAKSVYRWLAEAGRSGLGPCLYEERVVLIRARDADHALAKGEEEAIRYAAERGGIEYLGAIDTFEMFDGVGDGSEVYSLLRSTSLLPMAFLDRYHDAESAHSRTQEPER
jgi:hypothetical protein